MYINGKKLNLNDKHFIAQGGQGKVYGKDSKVYKIYDNFKEMIPEDKIKELHCLDRKNILNPQEVIFNKRNNPIGYSMNWIKNTVPICKLFSNTFRNKNDITNDMCIEVVEMLKETTHFIHSHKCLIVDGNEYNFLVDSNQYKLPYFIDVDSYQTPNFPATVIMPSIRDYKEKKEFHQLTDWYSFAVVACQIFIGKHPYKGKHPKFKDNDIEERCKSNISIFNQDVKLPKTVRDFSLIPSQYMDWFLEVLEKGKRTLPPSNAGTVNPVKTKFIIVTSTNNFDIEIVREFKSRVLDFRTQFGRRIVKTETHIYIDKEKYAVSRDVDVIFSPKNLIPILVKTEKNQLMMKAIKGDIIDDLNLNVSDKLIINNTLYVRTGENFVELNSFEFTKGIQFTSKNAWKVMANSTEVFNGIVYQNMIGKHYLTILSPENSSMRNILVAELDGYRILDMKYDNQICVIYGYKDNKYDRFVLKFDENYNYVCRISNDVENAPANFVTLGNGSCILITDNGSLETFTNNIKSTTVNVIKDPEIDSEMILCKSGNSVRFYRDNKLYKLSPRRK